MVDFVFCVSGGNVRLCRAVACPPDALPGTLTMNPQQAAFVEGESMARSVLCTHYSYVLSGGDSSGGIYQFAILRPLSQRVRDLAVQAREHTASPSSF